MATQILKAAPSLGSLYGRAATGAARAALGGIPGLGRGGGDRLPDAVLELSGVELRREPILKYQHVCGFRLRDQVPPTYPHVLGFPLQMELMTRSDFPFPAIGLVHIANRIVQYRPLLAEERITLRAWAGGLVPHDRGRQVDLRVEATTDGELAWSSTSTYLHREVGGSSRSAGRRPEVEEGPGAAPSPVTRWSVPGDIGRRYAAVSGDRNPIHMHDYTAKLLGMPRAIAHGMWLKARCLADLEAHLPDALDVEVRFKLPVFLPSRVTFAAWPEGPETHFAVRDRKGTKPHLEGAAAPAGPAPRRGRRAPRGVLAQAAAVEAAARA